MTLATVNPAPEASAAPAPTETRAELRDRLDADTPAGRLSREAAGLFSDMRRLGRDEADGVLAEVRRLADELEVEMLGGEPVTFDAGRAACYNLRAEA